MSVILSGARGLKDEVKLTYFITLITYFITCIASSTAQS